MRVVKSYYAQMFVGCGLTQEWNDLQFGMECRHSVNNTERCFWNKLLPTAEDVVSFAQDQLAIDGRPYTLSLAVSTPQDECTLGILELVGQITGINTNFERAANRVGVAMVTELLAAESRGEISDFEGTPSEIASFWEDFSMDAFLPDELIEDGFTFWYGAFGWTEWVDFSRRWLDLALDKYA
ncbi:hypothetical protein OAU50_07160 [Planctomycetota bacterium]|nr:hypothetical protein [Planctomycetota bacterium]